MDIFITVLLGFGVVFLGLILICLLILMLHKLMAHAKKPTRKKEVAVVEESVDEMDEAVLVAILTAAIAAYTPQSVGKFRVVSFRRHPQGPTH